MLHRKPMLSRSVRTLVCLVFACAVGVVAVAEASPRRSLVQDQREREAINTLIETGAFQEASQRVDSLLEARPHDARVLFARARVLAGKVQTDAVLDALLEAVRYGFVDFHRIDHDPLFERFRATEHYRQFVLAWPTLLDARGDADYEAARQRFSEGYLHRRDESLRLNIIAATDAESLDDALADLERIAEFINNELLTLQPAQRNKPHPWVTVLVCTQEDFHQLVPMLGVGGLYDPDQKHLISRDLGPSLRHEFVHALHWRHMEEIGQVHPLWFQEGLATLLEDLAPADAGGDSIVQSSWRTNIARRLARSASMTPWQRLFTLPAETFTSRNPRANYGQVRTIAEYLHAHGKLGAYYRALVAGFDDDPSGLAAFEAVFDRPVRDVERAFRVWTRDVEEVAVVAWPGKAVLPFRLRPGPVDGMRVDQAVSSAIVTPMDPENRPTRRLLRGDVILALEGTPVPTTDDFVRALGGRTPGERVLLLIRRGEQRFEVKVPLVERDEFMDLW